MCWVKGITLNYRNSLTINMDTMRKIVHEELKQFKVVYLNMILKVKKDWALYNVKQERIFRQVYKKGKIVSDFDDQPWGYQK